MMLDCVTDGTYIWLSYRIIPIKRPAPNKRPPRFFLKKIKNKTYQKFKLVHLIRLILEHKNKNNQQYP